MGASNSSAKGGNDGSPVADLVPGGCGAEKPRVFLWEAAAAAVRVVGAADAPWFVAKDVCAALDVGNPTEAVRNLDEDEKGLRITETLGGRQEMVCVNESGLYALIFRSRKDQAKVFRKWVTSEVLPQIRKTGAYAAPGLAPIDGLGWEGVCRELELRNKSLHGRVQTLEWELKRALLPARTLHRMDAESAVVAICMRLLGDRAHVVVTAATLADTAALLTSFATAAEARTQSVCARLSPYVDRWLPNGAGMEFCLRRHRSALSRGYVITSRQTGGEVKVK